jgi:hypothetical protein
MFFVSPDSLLSAWLLWYFRRAMAERKVVRLKVNVE